MKKLLFFAFALAFLGCSKTDSIQEYYVAKSEDPNFLVIDIPTSFLGINNEVLNQEEQAALESFQKLNVLMFRKTGANSAQFPEELAAVRQIIDGEQFDPLMALSDSQFSGKLLFEGSILKSGTAEELANDEQVRKVYLGRNFELKKKLSD